MKQNNKIIKRDYISSYKFLDLKKSYHLASTSLWGNFPDKQNKTSKSLNDLSEDSKIFWKKLLREFKLKKKT